MENGIHSEHTIDVVLLAARHRYPGLRPGQRWRKQVGHVVAVANQKGGVGKTTTVINLAAFMADCGQRLLAVDLDPQGNTTTGLGIEKSLVDVSVYDVLLGGAAMAEAVQATEVVGLHVVPATMDLAGAEVELTPMPERERKLEAVLGDVRDRYDFIFIDCPPSLGLLTLNALAAADAVLIPMQAEFFALEGLAQLLATVELVQQRLNPALELEGVVLTMFDGRTNLAGQVAAEVRKFFGDKVYQSVIPRAVRLSEAPSHGQPILRYDPRSKAAEEYRRLAEEVIRRHGEEQGLGKRASGAHSRTSRKRPTSSWRGGSC